MTIASAGVETLGLKLRGGDAASPELKCNPYIVGQVSERLVLRLARAIICGSIIGAYSCFLQQKSVAVASTVTAG